MGDVVYKSVGVIVYEYARLVELLDEVNGKNMVKLLDATLKEVASISHHEFMTGKSEAGEIAIFSQPIAQDIIDKAVQTSLKCLISEKMGDVSFIPATLEVCTRKYLERFLPKSPLLVLGYRNPLTSKTLAVLDRLSQKYNFTIQFEDLNDRPEFFEKYTFEALPALIFKGRVVCQGTFKEEDIAGIFERGTSDAGTAGRRIAELDHIIKELVMSGRDVYELNAILGQAKELFNKEDFAGAVTRCDDAKKLLNTISKKKEGATENFVIEKYCNRCGAYLEPEDTICPRCGSSAGAVAESEEVERLIEKCEELKEKLAILTRRLENGEIAEETFEILRERVKKEMGEVNSQLEKLGSDRCM
jgi:ssDNA-binding Zn-finger/Zn-ribbon topoisomerase 1